jgi:hypothetical protein
MTKNRVYDVFFVFYYIVFNLCTTNVVTSLAIECFEYLHEKEAINDDQNAESLQQQEFDMAKHMQDDDSYEIMPAPDGIQEIWTGRNEKHSFAEKDWKNSIFSRENSCCICSKRIVGTAIQCSLCHVNLHFECWQKTETAASSLSNSKAMQRFGTSFLRSPTLPTCVSKLHSDALQLHFSVHVRKIVNLLDVLILGPKVMGAPRKDCSACCVLCDALCSCKFKRLTTRVCSIFLMLQGKMNGWCCSSRGSCYARARWTTTRTRQQMR